MKTEHLNRIKIIKRLYFYHQMPIDKIAAKYQKMTIEDIECICSVPPKSWTPTIPESGTVGLGSKRETYNESEAEMLSCPVYYYDEVKRERPRIRQNMFPLSLKRNDLAVVKELGLI